MQLQRDIAKTFHLDQINKPQARGRSWNSFVTKTKRQCIPANEMHRPVKWFSDSGDVASSVFSGMKVGRHRFCSRADGIARNPEFCRIWLPQKNDADPCEDSHQVGDARRLVP